MCSFFEMENYQGDLTDIVRASGGGGGGGTSYGCKTSDDPFSSDWQYFPPAAAMNFSSAMEQPREYSFGDPFSDAMRDPLLQELDLCAGSSASTFFNAAAGGGLDDSGGGGFGGSGTGVVSSTIGSSHEDELKRPCNIFSRMLQISPARNKFPISPCDSPLLGNSPRALINTCSELNHFVDNTGLQISSPRNPAGIKRRKSQARKVVCVPAPVASNGRPNGEVIPSDLWAWRKYGQKPIKGSPYPRGYYRCSSSKGCSARKQVERSRTDPNMLVITYTSEHNHPWPTQRNALAGSSRSQQSKNNAANSKLSASSQPQKTIPEGDRKETTFEDNNVAAVQISGGAATTASTVKEEFVEEIDKQLDVDDGDFSEGFPYRLTMPGSDDFFADLEELGTDPLNLLFTQGPAPAPAPAGDGRQKESKAMDVPFGLFDWAADNSTSFKEGKRGFY